jgi:hypothetical protein
MSAIRIINFTDLCINGSELALSFEGDVNECEIYPLIGRLV